MNCYVRGGQGLWLKGVESGSLWSGLRGRRSCLNGDRQENVSSDTSGGTESNRSACRLSVVVVMMVRVMERVMEMEMRTDGGRKEMCETLVQSLMSGDRASLPPLGPVFRPGKADIQQ